jgi:hypothetical protein
LRARCGATTVEAMNRALSLVESKEETEAQEGLAAAVVALILSVPELRQRLADGLRADDPWLDVHGAAGHLGISAKALRKIAGERREIAYEQDGPGCKMWFRRSVLDGYRAGYRNRPGRA